MNKTDAIVLILRQLEGTADLTDERALDAWLEQNPEHRAMRNRIVALKRADWRTLRPTPTPEFVAQQREILDSRMQRHEVKVYRRDLRIRIAAVVTLGLLATLFIALAPRPTSPTRTLHFSKTTLEEVAQTLEHLYPIRVHVEHDRTLHFTGTFMNADADDVLTALQASLPVTLERHNHVYVLKLSH